MTKYDGKTHKSPTNCEDRVPGHGVTAVAVIFVRRPGRDLSARHTKQANERIIPEAGDCLKGHVVGALDGPLVVLLEEDRVDQPVDGALCYEVLQARHIAGHW